MEHTASGGPPSSCRSLIRYYGSVSHDNVYKSGPLGGTNDLNPTSYQAAVTCACCRNEVVHAEEYRKLQGTAILPPSALAQMRRDRRMDTHPSGKIRRAYLLTVGTRKPG